MMKVCTSTYRQSHYFLQFHICFYLLQNDKKGKTVNLKVQGTILPNMHYWNGKKKQKKEKKIPDLVQALQ